MHFTAANAKACCVNDVIWYDKFTVWNNLSCHNYEGRLFQTIRDTCLGSGFIGHHTQEDFTS